MNKTSLESCITTLLLFLLLLAFAFAQFSPALAHEEYHPDTLPPFQVNDVEIVEVIKDSKQVYDVYDRVKTVTDYFPFGYVGVVEYEWFKDNFHRGDGVYEPVLKNENAVLYKDGESVASYSKEYDTSENVVNKSSEGKNFIKVFLYLVRPFFNISQREADKILEEL